MKLAVLVGASLLVAGSALAQGVTPTLDASKPITLKLVDAGLEETIAMIGRYAGVTIQWDATVSAEARSQPVTMSFANAPLDKALGLLTQEAGLTYVVVDAKTVRITPLPQ